MSARQPTLADILRRVCVEVPEYRHIAKRVMNLGGGRPPVVFSSTLVNAALATSVETVAVTTPGVSPGLDSPLILLIGQIVVSAIGTAGTGLTGRVRQGTAITGTQIGGNTGVTTAAGNFASALFVGMDTPGAVAGLQYSFTGQVTAATANSTLSNGFLVAIILA